MSTHTISRSSEVPPAPAAGAATPSPTNPHRRILVVDDDIAARQTATELLIESGYAVDGAEDGAAAWNTLQTNRYDLVVTDHRMPKVTGLELVKRLRAARMALPVILVSGAIPAEELNRHPCLQLAATLLKPFTAEELLLAVREVLRRTAGTREPIPLGAASRPSHPPGMVYGRDDFSPQSTVLEQAS